MRREYWNQKHMNNHSTPQGARQKYLHTLTAPPTQLLTRWTKWPSQF